MQLTPSPENFTEAFKELHSVEQIEVKNFLSLLEQHQDPDYVKKQEIFFQCVPGGYGEFDQFYGIKVPVLRQLSKKLHEQKLNNASILHTLLLHPVHEVRFAALILLIHDINHALKLSLSSKSNPQNGSVLIQSARNLAESLVTMYVEHRYCVNNWDLVDLSAPEVFKEYLRPFSQEQKLQYLEPLIKSPHQWSQRIAILSQKCFIDNADFGFFMEIAPRFLDSPFDMVHKPLGWMLRLVGKQSEQPLLEFLEQYTPRMPRAALRSAIEGLTKEQRKYYLSIKRQA